VLKRLILGVLGLLFAVVLILILTIVLLRPEDGPPVSIDFTRYLTDYDGATESLPESFVAMPGDGRLLVTCAEGATNVSVRLNGLEVLSPEVIVDCKNGLEVPVTLAADNAIAVAVDKAMGGAGSIRIKQSSEVRLHVLSRVHFNTNVSNFVASRAFYGKLGFSTLSGFPDTNTQAMARAIGIETPTAYDGSKGDWAGGYLLHGELIGLGFLSGAIDLIEFTIPRDETPPYAKLNHLGMARAALQTTDLDADYAYLTRQGIPFLSAPASRSDGTRFVIFTDPDGTFYELIEVASTGDDAKDGGPATHLVGFGPLNVNVSDFERSRAWYQMFGFEVTKTIAGTDSVEVARAMGFDEPFSVEGAILTHVVDGSTMELVQWLSPYDPERAYPLPVNHLGIHRTALATTDIAADVATLKAQGVEFVSPVTPCCSGPDSSGSIVAFYDPDGTIVELVEQSAVSWVMPSLLRLRDLLR
jgi:catechol 2,3-dioxygenase-like lactoylglutathione lyase family enzyme